MSGYVYILKSGRNGRYYVGSSVDAEARLKFFHNKGKVRATKYMRPWELVFKQECKSLTQARQIEAKIKLFKSRRIIEEIVFSGNCDLII